jgi:hypothetical protein
MEKICVHCGKTDTDKRAHPFPPTMHRPNSDHPDVYFVCVDCKPKEEQDAKRREEAIRRMREENEDDDGSAIFISS